ncbi:MAG: response regulator [Chitinophagales bacterium]
MQNIRILIVEDESLVALDMSDMLTRLGYEVLPAAYSYDEAVAALQEHKPDLVLADINLSGEKTGIDLARFIRKEYAIPIVFITSHSDKGTVAEAAATQPNGYLVKPFSEEDLFTSVEVALSNFSGKAEESAKPSLINDSLFVKTDNHFVKVNVADILWLESDHNYLYIVTDKNKHIVRSNFKDFLTHLPATDFMQVHKSYIINLKKIEALSHTEVVLNKTAIPLSRNYKDELFDRIKRVQ